MTTSINTEMTSIDLAVMTQEKVGKFVSQNVFLCCSDIVERLRIQDDEFDNAILEALPQTTNIINVLTGCWEDYNYKELETYKEQLAEAMEHADSPEQLEELQEALENTDNAEFNYAEIFEYWFVSDYLAEKLEAKGEMIIDEFNCKIWGRACTGQAILLDYVINEICKELEII